MSENTTILPLERVVPEFPAPSRRLSWGRVMAYVVIIAMGLALGAIIGGLLSLFTGLTPLMDPFKFSFNVLC